MKYFSRFLAGASTDQAKQQQALQAQQPAAAVGQGLPSVEQVWGDPEFQGLPVAERIQVLRAIDPDYANLPEEEQMRVFEISGLESEDGGDDVEDMLRPAHDLTPSPPEGRSLGQKTAAALSPIARPMLEGAGMAIGGVVGAPAGGVGAIAGGAGGYVAGKAVADLVDEYAGIKQAPRLRDLPRQMASDLKTGAEYEMGGRLLGAAVVGAGKGAKYVFKKIKPESAEIKAGKTLIAHRTGGAIFAKNAKQARDIEEKIPGLKFTLAQATGDPATIKLERGMARGQGKTAGMLEEQKMGNDRAIADYYAKNFPEKEGIDDLIGAVSGAGERLSSAGEAAKKTVADRAGALKPVVPEETGGKIVEAARAGKAETREAASDLYEKVPAIEIDTSGLLAKLGDISKPRGKFEVDENIPGLIKNAAEILKKGGGTTVQDLQGLRSELIAELKDIGRSASPNSRASGRLSEAIGAVDQAIGAAEATTGAGSILKAANKFYRENYAEVYKQGAVGKILRKGPMGEATRVEPAKIPAMIFDRSDLTAATDLTKAVGKEKAASLLRDHAAYDLLQKATDYNGAVVPSKLKSWYTKHQRQLTFLGVEKDFAGLVEAQGAADAAEAAASQFEKSVAGSLLKADPDKAIANAIKGNAAGKAAQKLMGIVAGNQAAENGLRKAFADHIVDGLDRAASAKPGLVPSEFGKALKKYGPAIEVIYKNKPEQRQALSNMRRAYEIMVRNQKSPLGGGSDTAENQSIIDSLEMIPGMHKTKIMGHVLAMFKKYEKDKVEDFLTRAFIDGDYAVALTRKSETGGKEIDRLMTRLGKRTLIPAIGASADDDNQ